MDLFTAKKLTALRKYHSFSQEALAEKAGVSRQAVSKWERAEASPDTDNLLTLARIYSVSVDDILGDMSAEEIIEKLKNQNITENTASAAATVDIYSFATEVVNKKEDATEEKIIYPIPSEAVISEDTAVLPAAEAAVTESKKRGKISLKKNRKKQPPSYPALAKHLIRFPYIIVAVIIFILLGFTKGMWHPGWLVFLTVPAYYLTAFAFFAPTKKKILMRLPVYYFAVFIFLCLGLLCNYWAYAWIIFLTVPIYYWLISLIKNR